MNKGKILHIRDSRLVGSPEKLIIGQISELKDYYNFYFYTYYKNTEVKNKFESIGIDVLTIPFYYFNPLYTIVNLKKTIAKYGIKLICTHDYKSNFFGIICRKLCKISAIAVFHGRTSHNAKIKLYESIDNIFLKYFDKVIAVSNATRNLLINHGISEEKIEVIYNAVQIPAENKGSTSTKDIRKELGINKKQFLIASAGRLSKEKGFDYLIDAIKIIINKNDSLKPRLLIIGDGQEIRNIQKKISDLELHKYITLTGFRNDINDIFEQIDLFVLPSLTEGMPLVILESFSHKKAVISTNVGGIPEMIKDNETGFLVEKANPAKLASKIIYCMKNPERLEIVAHNAFLICQNKFNFKNQSIELKRIYDSLIE